MENICKSMEMKMEKEKHETTIRLENHCEEIAKAIRTGKYDFDPDNSEYGEPCAGDYLSDILDYRYTISSSKEYIGAHILVAFGGPNIWINTVDKCVEGYWGSDEVKRYYYEDELGLCEYMEEFYQCS